MDSITLYNKYKWMQKERMNYIDHLGIFCNTFFNRMKRILDQAIENKILNESDALGFYHRYIVYLLNYTTKTDYKYYTWFVEPINLEPISLDNYTKMQNDYVDENPKTKVLALTYFENVFKTYLDLTKRFERTYYADDIIEFALLTLLKYSDNEVLVKVMNDKSSIIDILIGLKKEILDLDYDAFRFFIYDGYDLKIMYNALDEFIKGIHLKDIKVICKADIENQDNLAYNEEIRIKLRIYYNDDEVLKVNVRNVKDCHYTTFEVRSAIEKKMKKYINL